VLKKSTCLFVCALSFAAFLTVHGGKKIPEVSVTAKVVGDKIVVTYNIPKKLHQELNKDLFNFVVAPVKGVEFGEIVYPNQKKKVKSGEKVVYRGKTVLTRSFKITGSPASKKLKITASYQVCLDEGMCLMPQSVEIELTLP